MCPLGAFLFIKFDKIMIIQTSQAKVFSALVSTLLIVTIFSSRALAHDNVVVIPMAGDDVPGQLNPFALIPADEVNDTDYTSANGITLDKVTGLEWQQVASGDDYTFDAADDYCTFLILDGKADWRLPTIKELHSIIDLGTSSPAINATAFPATGSVVYQTATDANLTDLFVDHRWGVHFLDGELRLKSEPQTERVRCVRSNGRHALVQVFKDNGNGSVADRASGLNWQKQNDNVQRNHADAIAYCQDLVLAASSDWRLPRLKELVSIVDFDLEDPVINEQLFPGTSADFYWSAQRVGSLNAWAVNFTRGDVLTLQKFANSNYVRCVH